MYFKDKEAYLTASHLEVETATEKFADEFDTVFISSREWLEKWTIDHFGETIEIETTVSSGCGCCHDEPESYFLPLSYLWHKDWKVEYQKVLDEEKRVEEKRKAERKTAQAIKDKERRHKRYLELKEEFEPELLS